MIMRHGTGFSVDAGDGFMTHDHEPATVASTPDG